MNKFLLAASMAVSAFCALSTPAHSLVAVGSNDNFAQTTVGITGVAPVYCKADLSDLPRNINLGNELGWEAFSQDYNFMVQCNTQADISVTISGANACSDEHVFGGVGNLQRNFCLQGDAGPNAKLPYSVKAWGRNAANAACGSDFHNIISGGRFHLARNCITQEGTGAWSNYKTNLLMRIAVDPLADPLHLPAGVYSDTLEVLVSWQ